jgi:hypothetical protein
LAAGRADTGDHSAVVVFWPLIGFAKRNYLRNQSPSSPAGTDFFGPVLTAEFPKRRAFREKIRYDRRGQRLGAASCRTIQHI